MAKSQPTNPSTPTEPSPSKVANLIGKIKSSFNGEGMTVLALNEDLFTGQIKTWIPTGLLPFDYIMGGGFPTSRVVEIYGPEACFKTGTSLMGLDNCVLMGGLSVLNDAEQALDRRKVKCAEHENFLYLDDNILENFYTKAESMMKTISETPDVLSMYVWDSLPTTMPQAVFTEGFGKAAYGAGAKMHAERLPVMLRPIKHATCCFVIVNQVRDNMDAGMFDDPYTTPGGWVPKFLASIRVQVSKSGKLFWTSDKSGDPVGFYVKAYTVKNKIVQPMRSVKIPITFDLGGDPAICLLAKHVSAGRYAINDLDLGGTFLYRGFREVYRDNLPKILDWFKTKFSFEYAPAARASVEAYTKLIYERI
jgi:recombination protein RecA